MKRFPVLCLLVVLLTGCSGTTNPMEAGLSLRSRLLQAEVCTFDAEITADYGDKLHIFSMKCRSDEQGNVTFVVSEPETIAGISGTLSAEGGELTFSDTALHFPLLAEEQLSPVSAPWILIRTLRGGNMIAACEEEGAVCLSIEDSFDSDALRLDIRLSAAGIPEAADILYDGRRILSVAVANFEIL